MSVDGAGKGNCRSVGGGEGEMDAYLSLVSDPEMRIEFRYHAVKRMFQRHISKDCIKNIILHGLQIEAYPDAEPFPACLMYGTCDSRPIHCVVAVDRGEKILAVITAYEPDNEYWEDNNQIRRKT